MYSIYAGDELLYSDVYPLETRKVTSPTLKMGVDEAGSLEFTVSEVNKCYTKLLRMKTIITVKKLNPMTHAEEPIWDGRILREDRDFYKNKKLYVEGALAFLNDSCQPLKEYADKDLEALVTAILDAHNSIVQDSTRELYWGGIADDFKPPQIEYWITKYEYTIDAIKNLADYLGCHFIIKKDPSNGLNKIWFFKNQCGASNQSIVFTKNLMDYTENYDLSKLATVLLPLCKTDRETSDKPINVGTTIDLTTPQPYDDTKGWGVFCPLSTGWAQNWSPMTAYRSVTKGKPYTYVGGDFNSSTYDNFHITIAPDASAVDPLDMILVGDLDSDGNINTSFSLKRLITEPIPLGVTSPNEDAGANGSSFHAYQFVIEDNASIYNRAQQIKAYLYYRPKNSSDSWTLFKRNDTEVCSGWGLYNDDSSMRWPNIWNEDPARLAFEVYAPSGQDRAVPDTDTYEWALRISFGLPDNDTWDDTAAHFRSRVKFAKLFAIAGVRAGLHGVKWIEESGTYKHEISISDAQTNTGIYSPHILNLKRCNGDNQTYYGRPWAISAYLLANLNRETGEYSAWADAGAKIFTGDIDVRVAVHRGSRDITDVDLLRFNRDPVANVQNSSRSDLGFTLPDSSKEGAMLWTLQSLNYGWLKYLHGDNRCRVAVLEIDLDKFSSYFLTATNTNTFLDGDTPCVATVWKIKNDPNIPDWIPLKGRDNDVDDGFEYHFIANGITPETYMPMLSLSANRSGSTSRTTHEDLLEDDPATMYVLNPNKYEFVSSDQVTRRCFEKEMHFYYRPEEGYSHHILLCLYSSYSDLSVTMATDEELYSILAVGQDPNGIDKSKETPMRHTDDESHTYVDPDKVYDDKLGYGTIVPPKDSYRLLNSSEMAAVEALPNVSGPFPNVYGEGGYYGPHTSIPFDARNPNDGIVQPTSEVDTNFKTCVFFVKPSYVDETGKLCTKSIYLSTTMHGKSAMYVIFELSNGDRSAAKWTDRWVPKCRAIEYGKYINGYTTYNQKKITLPTCNDKDTLLEVFVSSYETEPSIWIHNPELTDEASYLTIGAANNGEIRLYADQINMFTSIIEPGDLNDQNGSPNEPPSYMRVRTRDFITIKSFGAYALLYFWREDLTEVLASVYVYDSAGAFKYCTDFASPNPIILLPNMSKDDKIKITFKVGPNESGLGINDLNYLQLYSLSSETLSKLSQGPLKASGDYSSGIEISADPSDQNANMFVSTSDYYIAKSTDKLALYIAPGIIPTTIEVDGETKDVADSQFYLKIVYQRPNNSLAYSIIYDNVYQETESFGLVTFTPSSVDVRFKVQLRIEVSYINDNNQKVFVNAPITPQTANGIILTPLIKQDYYPPSNALETYGHIEKRIEFEDAESSQELLERAQKYLRQSQFDEMQLKVKALDMTLMGAQVNNLHIGDKINVSSPPHGLYRDFVIREMSIPFDKPENTTFELGWDNKDSLAKLIRKEKSKW